MLTPEVQAQLMAYYTGMARKNGTVFQIGATFAISPSVQQKIVEDMQNLTDLSRKINFRLVSQRTAQVISFGVNRGITTRNDQSLKERAFNKAWIYTTMKQRFNWVIPWENIDAWAGTGDLKKILPKHYLQAALEEALFIGLNGLERHADPSSFYDENDPGAQLKRVDRGWSVVLGERLPGNVVTEWVPGTGVIIFGKVRTLPLSGIEATSEEGGTKTGIPFPGHGMVNGGMVSFRDQSGYVDQDYQVDTTSTEDKVIINKPFATTTFGASAVMIQRPDFANIGELIVVGKRQVPDGKRQGLEAWIGDDILAAYEQKIYASENPATPSEHQYMARTLNNYGGLPGYHVADFPDSEIWISNPKLVFGIYELKGSRRREAKEDQTAEGFADRTYVEKDNVVEDPERFVCYKNLRMLEEYVE